MDFVFSTEVWIVRSTEVWIVCRTEVWIICSTEVCVDLPLFFVRFAWVRDAALTAWSQRVCLRWFPVIIRERSCTAFWPV